MRATLLKTLEPSNPNVVEQLVYLLNPPLRGDDGRGEYSVVVTSAANVRFSGPETYIFPATEDGEITDWGELPGSERGVLSGRAVLEALGYEVTP